MRFVVSGAIATLASYVVFMAASSVTHYAVASFLSWLAGIPVGFALNRRFTFQITGRDRVLIQLFRFALGSVGTLAVNEVCLFVLIGQLHADRTPAFIVTLAITATLNFLFSWLYTFRPTAT